MARRIQITAHLPAEMLAQIDNAAREEEEAANRLTGGRGHHVPRNTMVERLIEIGLAAGPYGKPPPLAADVDEVLG